MAYFIVHLLQQILIEVIFRCQVSASLLLSVKQWEIASVTIYTGALTVDQAAVRENKWWL